FAGLDSVGVVLRIDEEHYRRSSVRGAVIADVLDRIDDLTEIGHAYRRVLPIGHDQRNVIVGPLRLIVRTDLPAFIAELEKAFRAIGVRRADHGAYVFERDA